MKYNIPLEKSENDPLNKILKQIEHNRIVLEFGCANGRMTKVLKEELNCEVYIVELEEEAFNDAIKYAKDGICGDIMDFKWLETFKDIQFDYIIFADVLEHLYDPQEVLKKCNGILKEDGSILVSVPNIAHNDIIMNLYSNEFNYTSTGLLDDTHIRFFAYENLEAFFKESGYGIIMEDCIIRDMQSTEQRTSKNVTEENLVKKLLKRPLGEVYQFVLELKKYEYIKANKIKKVSLINDKNNSITRTVFYDIGNGFNNIDKVSFIAEESDEEIYYNIKIPDGVKSIRFDPVEGKKCIIKNLTVFSNNGDLITHNVNGIRIEEFDVFYNDDPQFIVDIEDEHILWIGIKATFISYYNEDLFLLLSKLKNIEMHKSLSAKKEIENQLLFEKIRNLENTSDELTKVKESLEKELVDERERLQSKLNIEKENADKLIESKSKDIEFLNNKLKEMNLKIERVENEYNIISNSIYWRITKPIRIIIDLLKRVLKKYKWSCLIFKGLINLKNNGFKATIKKIKDRNKRIVEYNEQVKEWEKGKQNYIKDQKLKVSIIVPNYNHEKYLEKRLDSIYGQTYKNIEVILLDDCSKDKSPEILKNYEQKYPDITKFYPNEKNSGGVFHQWAKGISLATGELCWIAESDDFADTNFIETLVEFFRDDAVMLAYGHMTFCNNNKPSKFTFEDYLAPIEKQVWNNEYIRSSSEEAVYGLGIKNVIPNASGVIFRRPISLQLLSNEEWLNMKICGDWVFYLHLMAGGKIAYSPNTNNYFNLHDDSASKKTHTKNCYYYEHEMVAMTLAELYYGCDNALKINHKIIHDYYNRVMPNPSDKEFNKLYSYDKIMEMTKNRKISILISIYAFTLGGGEIFPIRLANELKLNGYPVTIHCMNRVLVDENVREMLRDDIPVVYATTEEEFTRVLEEFHFDVLNTHHQSNQHMVSKIYESNPQIFENIKHVATMHGMYEILPKEYIMNYLAILDNSVDIWTRVAEKNKEPFEIANIYDENKHVFIPNGISVPNEFDITREQLNIPEDAFVLCLASRALPEKGWAEAIECVNLAREKSNRDLHLIMLGNGEMYDKLKAEHMPNYIHMLGFVQDTCKYYSISDMAFLPSYYPGESMPLTIIESLCVGKPVIASSIGEIPLMLKGDKGIAGELFELENGTVPIEKVAQIIVKFIIDKKIYEDAKNIAINKSTEFRMRNVARQYINIYKK